MDETPVPVMIVDDQPPFLSAARMVVTLMPGFEVVAEAASGEEAVALADETHPRLVLMDINLGAMNGIEATRRIVAAHPGTVVVLVSTYQAADLPGDAADCGAAAYVNKEELEPSVLFDVWAGREQQAAR